VGVTLGGQVYHGQVAAVVHYLQSLRVCLQLWPRRRTLGAARRVEYWGHPAYLAAVARILATNLKSSPDHSPFDSGIAPFTIPSLNRRGKDAAC
jgi:hypothetical protein